MLAGNVMSLPSRERELKQEAVAISIERGWRSLPSRERELKLDCYMLAGIELPVAPFTGARVETYLKRLRGARLHLRRSLHGSAS